MCALTLKPKAENLGFCIKLFQLRDFFAHATYNASTG